MKSKILVPLMFGLFICAWAGCTGDGGEAKAPEEFAPAPTSAPTAEATGGGVAPAKGGAPAPLE